jgi:excisionase family DNA binding protein
MGYAIVMNSSEVRPFLKVSEAADLLHVHVNTLRRWSDAGLVESYRIGSRGDRRYMREDLVRFLANYNAYKYEL